MKRRTLLKSALAVPLLGTPALLAAVIGAEHKIKSDEALAKFIAHGATEEQYRMFKAINEHRWTNPDDYEPEN